MIYGYARVSTDGQSVNAQVAALRKQAGKVFREVASEAKTDRARLLRLFRRQEVVLIVGHGGSLPLFGSTAP